MAYEPLPITPAVITWARERAGFSLEAAAIDFPNISIWESPTGDLRPTYPQLEKLSEAFSLPIAVFFFPQPPDVPRVEETFRTLTGVMLGSLPPRIRKLLGKAKSMQLGLVELNDGVNPAKRLITRDLSYRAGAPIDRIVADVRAYLGISVEEQQSWRDSEETLKQWRSAITRTGVFVFKDAFKAEGYSGFCLYDDEFPIIYVNNSTYENRQTFTLFHELAHLLFRTSGIDKSDVRYIATLRANAQRVETVCNAFAGAFLVPEVAFDSAMAGRAANEASANDLAKLFNVSRAVIFRKFFDRGLVDENAYAQAMVRFNAPRRGETEGGNYYSTQLAYLGRSYVRLALSRYYQQRITREQLADYLNIAPRNVDAFEAAFAKGGS